MEQKKLRIPNQRKVLTRTYREARRAYIILIPFIFYVLLWNLIPLLYGLYLGFTEYNALGIPPQFVGLKNFRHFFSDPTYLLLLRRQIFLACICLFFTTIVSFSLALLLNAPVKFRGIYRTAIYVPNIAAVSTTTAVFVALLNPLADQGLNYFLVSLGMSPITWNYSKYWMFFWIVFYFVWNRVGPGVVIWLGGLQGIDPSLYEAARVDGASFWQQVWFITMPGLRYVAMFILLTGIIGTMQMFDVVLFISRGNPFGETDILMYRIYKDAFVNFNLGMAGAGSLILGLVTVIFALGYLWLQQKGERE